MASGASYRYLLSLPERVIRSLGALSGGLLREIGEVALPAAVRRTTLYRTMVDVALRFLVEEVGEVEDVYPSEGKLSERFILQRTASHGIELLGILTFSASPIWILAALADVTGAGHKLIDEISQALKEEGLLPPDTRFETMDHLLDGLEKASDHLATALNLPPMDVAALREEWTKLKEEILAIPPKNLPEIGRLEQLWENLRASSREQGRGIFVISSALAVSSLRHLPARVLWLPRAARSAARRTGKIFGESILDYYAVTLADIRQKGFLDYWRQEFRPYLRAAAEQFAPGHESLTERWLRRSDT
jgi:hypothetical protein